MHVMMALFLCGCSMPATNCMTKEKKSTADLLSITKEIHNFHALVALSDSIDTSCIVSALSKHFITAKHTMRSDNAAWTAAFAVRKQRDNW